MIVSRGIYINSFSMSQRDVQVREQQRMLINGKPSSLTWKTAVKTRAHVR